MRNKSYLNVLNYGALPLSYHIDIHRYICTDSDLWIYAHEYKCEHMWIRNVFKHIWITHWGRVTHICVGNLTIIGPDNGLSPGRRQVIIWTSAGILLIGPCRTNFSEILIGIHTFSFKKIHLKSRLRNGVHFVSASMWSDYMEQQVVVSHRI